MSETWTTAQAAQIVEKPLDDFQKIVERAPAKPKLLRRCGRRVRAFELGDLVYFSALDALKQDLTPKKQAEAYEALKRLPPRASFRGVEIGHLTYDFEPYLRLVRSNIEAARELLRLIDVSGAEPLIRGTSIEAHRIAALCEGMSVADILRDYPALEERQVAAAKAYARGNPKVGRPYPTVTAKQAMRRARVPELDDYIPARK